MGRRKCPWTSFTRHKKQRSKNIKMSKETKVGLAKSDEGHTTKTGVQVRSTLNLMNPLEQVDVNLSQVRTVVI